jgi:hypothetical protein
MISEIIAWSLRNRFLVLLVTGIVVGGGVLSMLQTPVDAIPDLSDVQVIVQTNFKEQAPQIVEDQVTYPIASEMLKVPGARVVRGYSFFGLSLVYVIFEDGTDIYWARSRVLEYMSGLRPNLPAGVDPTLGPDATGVGWVFQYTLESDSLDLAELRTLQDWYIRYQLTAVPGVSEVASVGGFTKQYQVEVDPERLRAFNIPVTRVAQAIGAHNVDIGARVLEMGGREYMIRGLGYLEGIDDIKNVAVGATPSGTPIRVADVATVQIGPAPRRGAADLDGKGEVVAGIVVMRFGSDALNTIEAVKDRLEEVRRGLPAGVRLRTVYDRSDLIHEAISTLREKLVEESLIVAAVAVLFLLHVRSALVAIVTLPLGILHRRHGGRGHCHDREHAQASRTGRGKIGPMGHRPQECQAGWAAVVLLAPHHHVQLPPGICPGAAGRPALQAAGVHQNLRHGRLSTVVDHIGARTHGIPDSWNYQEGEGKSHQPTIAMGIPARYRLCHEISVGGLGGGSRCSCGNRDTLATAGFGIHATVTRGFGALHADDDTRGFHRTGAGDPTVPGQCFGVVPRS